LLDQQSLNDKIPIQDPIDTIDEISPEFAMPFWDWCPKSDNEHIEEVFIKDMSIFMDTSPRSYNLRNKGPIPNTSSSFKEDNTPPPAPPKPNDTSQGKINNKTRKSTPTNIDKPCMSASDGNNAKLKTCEQKLKKNNELIQYMCP